MKHSIKTKLIWTLTGVITVALLTGGAIIIWQNTRQMQRDIYLNALSFAELVQDRVISSYEQFYLTENFLQFRKLVNPLLEQNRDVATLQIIGKSGQLLYDSSIESETAYIGKEREHAYDIDRSRDVKPSILFKNEALVYVKQSEQAQWFPVNRDESLTEFSGGEVANIFYPHQNARQTIVLTLSYEALWERIWTMGLSIFFVLVVSMAVVSGFALSLAGKLVRPLKHLEEGVLKVGQGQFGAQVAIETDDEIGILAENFNLMSKTLKKNTEELLKKEALEKELDIAREIQQNMLPKKEPSSKAIDITGSVTPATSIGGDIYDFIETEKFGLFIFIADVTGHGVPAGMAANITLSSLYSFSKVYQETDVIFTAMNTVVHAKSKRNMFATAFLGRLDEEKKILYYCNAGHEEMVYFDSAKKEVRLLGKGGMALGMIPDLKKLLKEEKLTLKKGDVVILYTDGIPEAWKTEKQNLGIKGFVDMVKQVMKNDRDARGIRDELLKQVTDYRSGYPQQDDITLVVLKMK